MTPSGPIVRIVDDDPSYLRALERLLRAAGYEVLAFDSAEAFLKGNPSTTGCVLLDLQMPGQSGLDLQQTLARRGEEWPIIFLTGHGDVPITVRAMKAGAADFLLKPVKSRELLEAVRQAILRDEQFHQDRERLRALRARLSALTPREREVLALIVSGKMNKEAAAALNITERTVKAHRRQIMEKFEAQSLAELVSMATRLGLLDDNPDPRSAG